jgi:hypothetical protein
LRRNERRFLTFRTEEEAKKARIPKRLFRETFTNEDEVEDDDDGDEDDDEEELELERERRRSREVVVVVVGSGGAAGEAEAEAAAEAAMAAASCSLECRRSARRRRELSGLRRRGSRIISDTTNSTHDLHGPSFGLGF